MTLDYYLGDDVLTEMSIEETFQILDGASPDDVWRAHAEREVALLNACDDK